MPTFNGTPGDDTLDGTVGDDTINGLGGNDIIRGGGGADIIDAGDGDDTIYIIYFDGEAVVAPGDQIDGGAGNDTLYVNGDPGPDGEGLRYSIANVALTGVENLITGGLYAGVTQAQLFSLSNILGDLFLVQSGAITFNGLSTSGLSVELNAGGNQLDLRGLSSTGTVVVTGGGAADTVFGSSIGDHILGGGGNDILRGEGGFDLLEGGGGDDILIGGADDDTVWGGAGRDTILGTADELNGDSLLQFTAEDRIVISDATLSGFSVTVDRESSKLIFTGGTFTLHIFFDGTFAASAAPEGGVQINLIRDVDNDFNHDGRSDILWRNVDGTIGDWLANENGSFTSNGSSVTAVPNYWRIAGTGDFNGDGFDDILWRGDGGEVGTWLGGANGSFAYNATAGVTAVPNSWQIVGVGDFNADGRDDILWRHSDGTIGNWLANADGSFTANNANVRSSALNMHVAAVGDFDADGDDDILWRDTNGTFVSWIAFGDGAFTPLGASRVFGIGNDWHIIGVGDFNGDGTDDILWRHDDGTIANWLADFFGVFSPNGPSLITITNDWNVVGIGDYNGDGRDDILWRHDSGTVGTWLAREDGTLAYNAAAGLAASPLDWHVEDRGILML
jgi:hypothetical protein